MTDPATAAATVHLVDDDPAVLTALSRLLRCSGYRVSCSASAQQFLLQPYADAPSCVILDLSMPELNGLALQRMMAASGDPRPVLFLTGAGDIPSGVEAMKIGAIDFLTKPIDGAALLSAVEEALRRGAAVAAQRRAVVAVEERVAELTAREREVMTLVIAGHPNKRIALFLGIAEKTVKIHRGRVMEKLAVDSVAELVRLAAVAGIAPAQPGVAVAPHRTPMRRVLRTAAIGSAATT